MLNYKEKKEGDPMEELDRRFRFCKRYFHTIEAMLLRVLDICKTSDTAVFTMDVHKASHHGVSLKLATIRLRVVIDLLIHILLPSCGSLEDLVAAKDSLKNRLQGIEVHKYLSLSVGLKSPKLPVTSIQSVYAIWETPSSGDCILFT
mmetsp:Transcript_8752/g.11951  ORF Transcript_8752/g.11951 Transcript_8752/m.11951 type:complete len:147 (+) Transcript_8752:2629-3069(+)